MNDAPASSIGEIKSSTGSSTELTGSSSRWSKTSSSVHLARSKQTWTGAGSAAGYVLRYLTPMRRLMVDILENEKEADRALAILVAHLVKAGFSGHDKGRLRDFLVRGIRSAAKARFDEAKADQATAQEQSGGTSKLQPPTPPRLDAAQLESPAWIGYWRDGVLQRSWRALERYQHARRYDRIEHEPDSNPNGESEPAEDLIHDTLKVAMTYPNESPELWAGRVAAMAGRSVTQDEFRAQLELARLRFAQQIADEVAQTLEQPDPKIIHAEIKTLGLGKAFAGVKVLA